MEKKGVALMPPWPARTYFSYVHKYIHVYIYIYIYMAASHQSSKITDDIEDCQAVALLGCCEPEALD